jgi:hypothetical protein
MRRAAASAIHLEDFKPRTTPNTRMLFNGKILTRISLIDANSNPLKIPKGFNQSARQFA